jgi:hypothetical protein
MVNDPPLPLRGPGCPTAESLESFSAGDRLDEASEAHIGSCAACSTYVGALEQARQEFLRMRPVERFARSVERREAERGRRRWMWLAGLLPVAAAAAWLVIAHPPDDVRFKGGEFLVMVLREGMNEPAPVAEGQPLRAGDRLRFLFRAPADGYVMILDRDGTGRVTAFYPQGQAEGAAIGPSPALAPLPGSIRLDDAPGPEWIVLFFSPKPVRVEDFTRALREAPSPETLRVDCRGCRVSALRIEKTR